MFKYNKGVLLLKVWTFQRNSKKDAHGVEKVFSFFQFIYNFIWEKIAHTTTSDVSYRNYGNYHGNITGSCRYGKSQITR